MNDVMLYSTGCPRCNILKKKLNEKGITFEENNDVEQMIEMNITQVPVLSVDGECMEFAQANEWINSQGDAQ